MKLDGVYGTRPDLLPRFLVRLVRAEPTSDRLLVWAGCPGVELLNLDQHLQYVHESIDRYPRSSDGTIEWNYVYSELVLCSVDSDSVELSKVIQECIPYFDHLVLFWGSLAVPSVKMRIDTLVSCVPDILERFPEFWIYFPDAEIVLEYSFFGGTIIVARLPVNSDEPGN